MTFAIRFLLCGLTLPISLANADDAKKPHVFDLPRIQSQQAQELQRAVLELRAGKPEAAERRLQAAIQRVPHDAIAHYNLACALAKREKPDQAMQHLLRSVELGYRDRKHLESDADLEGLHGHEGWPAILRASEKPNDNSTRGWRYTAKPASPQGGEVVIHPENATWNSSLQMFQVRFDFPPQPEDKPVVKGLGEVGKLLMKWFKEGTAAGNSGDLYDNHDSDHSNMNYKALPQLTRVEFSEAAKKRGLHHGLQRFFLYDAITIGNSSTAITSGPFWRSQGRFALTQPGGASRLYVQYRSNQLYFYPEHRDHDPDLGDNGKGRGDVFPANIPYYIISQGSSGSDRAFMNAVGQTLAAFHPDVKRRLAKSGMLMPVVQMILRASNKNARDYLTGAAHPTVFDGKQLDVLRMVKMAHEMKLESLPPLALLKVVEEDLGVVGVDYFDVGPRERIFDTPCAIARLVKSSDYLRRLVVSAEGSRDLNGRPLQYHWVVLRGDEKRIGVKKLNESGSRVELSVPYHERRPISESSKMGTNRLDIGVFVHNGAHYSPPAFISFCYSGGEKRVYDSKHRIRSIDYASPSVAKNYVDPLLDAQKDWRDEYQYEEEKLIGWTRIRGENRQQFAANGRLVTKRDAQGQPVETVAVRYVSQPRAGKAPLLVQEIIKSQ